MSRSRDREDEDESDDTSMSENMVCEGTTSEENDESDEAGCEHAEFS